MRNRLNSTTLYRFDRGRNRLESLTPEQEISPTLLEITTIYEKVKKGHENEVYRLSKFGFPTPPVPEGTLLSDPKKCPVVEEDETIPLVPSFPNLSQRSNSEPTPSGDGGGEETPSPGNGNGIRFLDFNKYRGLPPSKYLYFSGATNTVQSERLEGLSTDYKALLKSEYYWLNITDPNEADLAILSDSFNVHDFTISDIRETNTEEKIEFYQHYTFMSTRLLREVKVEVKNGVVSGGMAPAPGNSREGTFHNMTTPVDMDFNILLFKNFVITMHNKKWSSINDILGFLNLVCGETCLSPDWVLYSIFIELAQDAQYLLARIEPELNELRLESTCNLNEMSRVLRENYEMEFQLYTIQRFLKPKVNILRILKLKCGRRFGRVVMKLLAEMRDDFVEMSNDLRNLNHILERSQDTFIGLVNVEKSREGNDMSLVMKKISQVALIFLPIQTISGFFGMNVVVPFQGEPSTTYFWLIVLFSALVAIGMYIARVHLLRRGERRTGRVGVESETKGGTGTGTDAAEIRLGQGLTRHTLRRLSSFRGNKYGSRKGVRNPVISHIHV